MRLSEEYVMNTNKTKEYFIDRKDEEFGLFEFDYEQELNHSKASQLKNLNIH